MSGRRFRLETAGAAMLPFRLAAAPAERFRGLVPARTSGTTTHRPRQPQPAHRDYGLPGLQNAGYHCMLVGIYVAALS